ncbi:MAG: imidazole glycerol phosphate synthase cyclase subunit [Thermomicrobiales bacterium]
MTSLVPRLIACFDVRDGLVTKGHAFQDNIDIAPVEELARFVYDEQIDEVIVFDILASAERRGPDLDMVRRVSRQLFVPLCVGGGIRTVEDMHAVLAVGAEKISIDSAAVRNPDLITQGAREFGSQAIVLSMQVKRVAPTGSIPSGYEIAIDGARTYTGLDAVEWAVRGAELGAGEICVNSIDQDGTHAGFDLEITRAVADRVSVPIIASGGAGTAAHIAAAFRDAGASAAIISSLLYSPRIAQNVGVRALKAQLADLGIAMRPWMEPANESIAAHS